MQVVLHPEYGAPPKGILVWTWMTLILASVGLVFLYKTTTADPGFLPCGLEERNGKEKVCLFSTLGEKGHRKEGRHLLPLKC